MRSDMDIHHIVLERSATCIAGNCNAGSNAGNYLDLGNLGNLHA